MVEKKTAAAAERCRRREVAQLRQKISFLGRDKIKWLQ